MSSNSRRKYLVDIIKEIYFNLETKVTQSDIKAVLKEYENVVIDGLEHDFIVPFGRVGFFRTGVRKEINMVVERSFLKNGEPIEINKKKRCVPSFKFRKSLIEKITDLTYDTLEFKDYLEEIKEDEEWLEN